MQISDIFYFTRVDCQTNYGHHSHTRDDPPFLQWVGSVGRGNFFLQNIQKFWHHMTYQIVKTYFLTNKGTGTCLTRHSTSHLQQRGFNTALIWPKSNSSPGRATDFDHTKQCIPVPNVNSGTDSETSSQDFRHQNFLKRRRQITQKIFPVATFSNGRSGVGNKINFFVVPMVKTILLTSKQNRDSSVNEELHCWS